MKKVSLIVAASVVLFAALPAMAVPEVYLSAVVHPSTHTWDAYATISNDCAGIAAWCIDVKGTGGLTVTSSHLAAPYYTLPDGKVAGFDPTYILNSGGNAGLYIHASEPVIYGDVNDPALDAKVIQGLGQVSGSYGSVHWDAPLLIASGSYTGEAGFINITGADNVNQFMVLKNVSGGPWKGPGNVMMSGFIVYDAQPVYVPEPASLCLLAVGAMGLLRRRQCRV